jgi:hypothetical protein
MSTRVGTLQGTSAGRSIWPAAVLVSLVMLTIAVAAISLSGDPASETAQREGVRQNPQTVVGTAANTPTELSGGIVGGAAATTLGTSAGSSSIAIGVTPAMQAAIVASRNAADAPSSELSGGSTGNTPSELTGGMFDRYGLHQRI